MRQHRQIHTLLLKSCSPPGASRLLLLVLLLLRASAEPSLAEPQGQQHYHHHRHRDLCRRPGLGCAWVERQRRRRSPSRSYSLNWHH